MTYERLQNFIFKRRPIENFIYTVMKKFYSYTVSLSGAEDCIFIVGEFYNLNFRDFIVQCFDAPIGFNLKLLCSYFEETAS
jgi:hypothetical protein